MDKLLIVVWGLMMISAAQASSMSSEFTLTNQQPVLIVDLTHPRPNSDQAAYIYRICRSAGTVEVYRTTAMFKQNPPVRPVAILNNPNAPCRDLLLHKGEMLILRNQGDRAVAAYDLVGG